MDRSEAPADSRSGAPTSVRTSWPREDPQARRASQRRLRIAPPVALAPAAALATVTVLMLIDRDPWSVSAWVHLLP
jgi:hypothetical protein